MGKGLGKILILIAFLLALTLSCSMNLGNDAGQTDVALAERAALATQKTIQASDRQTGDWFGESVGLSGNYAIVGALYEGEAWPGSPSNAGAAYIFERSTSGTWTQRAILRASDRQDYDNFGDSVAISGNYAIVGAPLENGGSGDPSNNTGAAYIFERSMSGTWSQKAILYAAGKPSDAAFGQKVAMSGSYAAVAASNQTVHIFKRNTAGTWALNATIRNSNGGTDFGKEVAIDADKIIIQATNSVVFYHRNSSGAWVQKNFLSITPGSYSRVALGISGTYAVAGTPPYGAYIFEYNSTFGTWGHKAFVQSSDFTQSDEFGFSASISGTYVAVGAYAKDSSRGAAYVFTRQSGSWQQTKKVTASDGQAWDDFGQAVDLNSSHYLLVGAPVKDSSTGKGYIYE